MKTIVILLTTLLFVPPALSLDRTDTPDGRIAQITDSELPSPQEVRQTAKNITVRVTSANNGGSGVLIAKKGNTYLVLTNAHLTRRASQFQIQAPDGQKYIAKPIDGGFDPKYDLALLQFTSQRKYTLADLSDVSSPLAPERTIYSAGFPFDTKEIGITSGQVSQLSDLPFDNGTQIGYTITKGNKGIRQGMSGGAIIDERGKFLGINTISAAPILPNYTYNDGSKPLARLAAQYRTVNWGIPVYNFLVQVKPDILYGYQFSGLKGEIQRQVTPTGYLAKLNNQARQMTVRIEAGGENGSGVIIAKEGNSYYVLTAKHVVENLNTKKRLPNPKIITYDQDIHNFTSTVVATGADDLAVIKFSSNNNYPLAQLAEYNSTNDELVFVGGFPARQNINSPLWQWQLNSGVATDRELGQLATQNKESFSNGYDLVYSSVSYGGMSGGPVFDAAGKVIGIHGRAEITDKIILGQSLGISIQTFRGLADRLQVNSRLLSIAKNSSTSLNKTDSKAVFTAMKNIASPQEGDSGERWLAYGNQLYRTFQYDKSVAAFDRAIIKGSVLTGNYGKALALLRADKSDLAEVAISKAIAAVPVKDRANYYYFWKYQHVILKSSKQYDRALTAINTAIELKPNDLTLQNEKVEIFSDRKQYSAAIAIYDDLIHRNRTGAYIYQNRGILKSRSGDKQGAISDYNEAIKLNTNYAPVYNSRGLVKSDLGDLSGALADYTQAIKIDPGYIKAYINRGTIKSNSGNKQAAIADLNKAIEIDSKSALAYYNRGTIKLDLKDTKGAMADLDRAIQLNPKFDQAYINRGKAKSTLGDKAGAISDYDLAVKINPNNALAYYNRGVAKADLKDFKNAINDYNLSIKIAPNDADTYLKRGQARSALKDITGEIADYTQAIKINPNYPLAYLNRGIAKAKLTDRQGAIVDLNQAIKLNPDLGLAYLIRGNIKDKQGDKQGAIADFTQVIRINPTLAHGYIIRGITKDEIGDKQGAIADYDLAIQLNPKDANIYVRRGVAKYELNNKKGAAVDFSTAIDLDPKLVDAYSMRGLIKYETGNTQGAITDYDRAIKINPNSAIAYSNRGVARSALGDKGAIADNNRAIEIMPKNAELYYDRGMTKFNLGDKSGAIGDYTQAIQLNPNYAQAYYDRGIARSAIGDKPGAIDDLSKSAALSRQQGKMDNYQRAIGKTAKLKS
ncbi:tetratricopeptide repeat protein [Chamaesiphon sp. VAR_48_metabat_403]|uniref:tetratricopeptide repeat protein n=1 Tax=Chamaesiphon sp. VAR_48_metabat_403 TaxID=2964700 RepID=UPI00286E2877|nr:tetratricopeptide repeat protein [Chamaesiphon sp. VAR_48_metabat_403]